MLCASVLVIFVFQRCRKRNCKHILFVYMRVLKLKDSDPVVMRSVASLTKVELNRIRSSIPEKLSRKFGTASLVVLKSSSTAMFLDGIIEPSFIHSFIHSCVCVCSGW